MYLSVEAGLMNIIYIEMEVGFSFASYESFRIWLSIVVVI